MLEEYFRILLIEDDAGDADLLQEYLSLSSLAQSTVVCAQTLEEGCSYLVAREEKHRFDVILLDISLPDAHGIATVNKACQTADEIPIVILTGLDDEAIAVEALRAGAQDYLIKGKINEETLSRSVFHSVERKRLSNQLKSSEERYAISVRGANDGLWDWDLIRQTIYFSPRWKLMLGYEKDDITEEPSEWLQRVHPEDLPSLLAAINQPTEQPSSHISVEHRIRHKHGQYVWVLCRGIALRDSEGQLYRMSGSFTDITQRKQLEQKLYKEKELALVTLHSIGDAVITTDLQGKIQSFNPAAEQLTGWSAAEAKGQPIEAVFQCFDEETLAPLPNPVDLAIHQDQIISLSNHPVLVDKRGRTIAIDDSTAPIHSSCGQVMGSVVVFHDVSEARGRARQLSWQANHDPLTGLLNRSAFGEKVASAIEAAKGSQQCHVLCFLDLDHFKVVNDTCGHTAGDELLKQIATLIQKHVRKSDAVARVGGDEFAVLLNKCPLEQALQIMNALCSALNQLRFARKSILFKVGSSIGLSKIDATTGSVDEVMKSADSACRKAKQRGRSRVHVYRPEEQGLSRYSEEAQWFTRLSEALEHNRLQLFYQPIAMSSENLASISRCEVLLRLIDEGGSVISPAVFMPAAERYSLMPEIDRWVVRNCFEYLSNQHNHRLGGIGQNCDRPQFLMYSINLSGASVEDERFLEFIREQLQQYQITPSSICFEITETAAISNLKKAVNFIEQLKQLGCQFALDDFGTGMSSLAYLKNLPVDYLKIDGSFIQDIAVDQISCAMVTAIIQVAHLMGLSTVAEFVSSPELLNKVKTLGIDYMQGYAIAIPRPLTVLTPAC